MGSGEERKGLGRAGKLSGMERRARNGGRRGLLRHDGWLKALDAKSGTLLRQFKCGSGIIGQPVSYRGPDGKQYVAILAGVGGWSGAVVAGGLDTRDPTGALGFVGAMTDLPDHSTKGGMLYVFALP